MVKILLKYKLEVGTVSFGAILATVIVTVGPPPISMASIIIIWVAFVAFLAGLFLGGKGANR